MKRPEGFDAAPQHQKPQQQKPVRPKSVRQKPDRPMPARPKPAPQKPVPQKTARTASPQPRSAPEEKATPADNSARDNSARDNSARDNSARDTSVRDISAHATSARDISAHATSAREAKRAARERRRYERDEVRRFTRRSRHRRAAWVTAITVVFALVGTVTIAVYSPLLALTKIEITGTSSVDPTAVLQAVDGQLGTPLALVDSDQLTRDLEQFTLIQSYVTETVPPNTLIIHVTERTPVGSMVTASGFTVVDPAGVTITEQSTRPEGIPTIELAGADVDSDVFDSVVEVLLALPDSVASRVDRITAATQNDVTLVFSGAGQRVVWGSAEESNLKARVLAALMATQGEDARVEYDVSAPLSAVIRPV